MQPAIILAVRDENRRTIYEKFLEHEHALFVTVSSLREVVILAAQRPHNGILLDMPLVVRASNYEKALIEDALLALPSARANISKDCSEIFLLEIHAESGTRNTATEFVSYCGNFPPKIVFARNRVPLHLNALLFSTRQMSDPMLTCSIDCSEGGCFLFTTEETLVPDNSVWIKFIGLQDHTPIEGTIRWKRAWGHSDKVPGVGIRFEILTNSQLSELMERTKELKAKPS